MTGRVARRIAALLAVLAVAVSACSDSAPRQTHTDTSPTPVTLPTPVTTQTPQPSPSPPAGPAVVAWGVDGSTLSVVVANQGALEITDAKVLITALDGSRQAIASTSGTPESKCCTVLSLPPGKRFGLFADFGPLAARIRGVSVTYLQVHLAPWRPAQAPSVSVSNPVLGTDEDGTAVVTATLSARGATGPYVVGQAFLTDATGRLVGVISGRFYCFADGVSLRRRMQFFHPVPDGTRIAAVAAYPVPPGVPTLAGFTCPSTK